jgi:hypothetical protein
MTNRKKWITKPLVALLCGGMLFNCMRNEHEPNCINSSQNEVSAIENKAEQYSSMWDIDSNQLITPHRNNYYGTKSNVNGPVYTFGKGDVYGDVAIKAGKDIISYKNNFSKMSGSDKTFYWLCRVDDFNKDGVADQISWPRKGENMPIYNAPFPKDIQEKANKVLFLEDYIQDYIRSKK